MPIAPVHVPAGATVLVTRETARRRWLLTPHPVLDEQILGILGRAHALAPVELHGFTFLPGRADLLMTVPDRDRMSMFLQYVFKFISDAIRTERRWRWEVWSTRSTIDVLDPVRSIGALRSVHAGAVLGGLVPHPTDWPGVSSAAALLDDEEILTLWTPARERRQATSDDRLLGASRVYHLPLAPIPVLETSPRADRIALLRQIFDAIAKQHPQQPTMGRRWVMARDPLLPDPRSPEFDEVLAYDLRCGLRARPAP
jgi:hypothetical protein